MDSFTNIMLPLNPAEVAHRDARRLALVLQELGGEGAAIGGGWAASDLRGSWANNAAALGVNGPVDEASLDALVAFYRERGREPRIQVTPYEDPTLLRGLEARGFVSLESETVLVRSLEGLPTLDPIPELVFRPIDPQSQEDVDAFRSSQMTGFFGEEEPPAGMLPITGRVARSARAVLWFLELEGHAVGSGGLELFEESAVLIAGCVHAQARRRGLQSAFIRFRLMQAANRGLRYAIVASKPGGPTERNALRAGFSVAYTQLVLHQP